MCERLVFTSGIFKHIFIKMITFQWQNTVALFGSGVDGQKYQVWDNGPLFFPKKSKFRSFSYNL